MAKINGWISTIYEAWHDVASGTKQFVAPASMQSTWQSIVSDSGIPNGFTYVGI